VGRERRFKPRASLTEVDAPMTVDLERDALRESIADFCARECGTREQRDALTDHGREQHNDALYRRMADLGWPGVAIPAEYGGGGAGMAELCIVLEETARGMAPVGGLGPTLIVAGAYERFGTEEQKKDILGGICAGASEAIAMSEPGAGSDVGALTCRAEARSGGFVINGQKTWCSNAHFAEHILLIARTDAGGSKHHGLTMLQVPSDIDGLEIRGIDTMGGREVNDLYFSDCFVPESAVVGAVDQGWKQLMAGLNLERLILAALLLGTARRAFDDTLDYISQREQFGQPIGTFQALKHRFADLATELECCRLLVADVAAKVDDDPARMLPREASMAKLKVTETAKRIALEGMQMMGGYGYAMEYDMQRHVRATLVSTIFGGTSEVQREIIAKTYGL
jgi:alkylation response protein AidB-like acyl-CoA dehydrogenase